MRPVLWLSLSIAFFCGSCQTTRVVENPVAFDAVEASFIQKAGKATIDGHAFVTNGTGGVVNAAGQTVRLIPATAYARQRMAAIYGASKSIPARSMPRPDSDPEYIRFTRETKSESNGKFSFDKVAAGEYFIVSQMTWRKENGLFPDGAAMYETIKVGGSETEPLKVVVSGTSGG
jgi:hypothetical protein